MKPADQRSVGELLVECDVTVRQMLIDPDALDAAAMVRAWPEVVQAAQEFLDCLPARVSFTATTHGPQVASRDLTGERLHLMAAAMHLNLSQRDWPGDGPVDGPFLVVADNLVRAHDLVTQHLRRTDETPPAVLADAAAARTRVLHTLYVGSHAIQLAVRARTREGRISDGPRSDRRRTHQLSALRLVQERTAAFERVAGAEVYRLFPGSMAGEKRELPAMGRLREALAGWDVETRRALARDPSMANLTELTRVQTSTLALTRVVLRAAAARDVIDRPTFGAELEPRLEAAKSAWSGLHAILRDVTRNVHHAVSRDLRLAGSELVLALSDIVLDGTAVADSITIARRVDLGRTVTDLVDAMDAPHQASLLLLDAALDPRNRVNANAAQHLISQLANNAGDVSSPEDPWVDPRDLLAGRDITPPAPILGAITRQVEMVRVTSRTLAAGASTLAPVTAPMTTQRGGPGPPSLARDRSAIVAPSAVASVSHR